MERFGRALAASFANNFAKLMAVLRSVFGEWNYKPPTWIATLGRRLTQTRAGRWVVDRGAWVRANRRRSAIIGGSAAAALVVAVIAAVLIKNYLDSLPKPDYVKVTVNAPAEPDLKTGEAKKLFLIFSRSSARIDLLNKPIDSLIDLSPKMKGTWRWSSDSELEFTPSSPDKSQWEIGREYEVELSKKLFPDHVVLKDHDYKFTTPQVRGQVTKSEFYQDQRDASIKRAIYNITYNYVIDTEDFKKRVKLEYQSTDNSVLKESAKSLPYTVSFNAEKNVAYILSDSIAIPKMEHQAKLTISKGVRTTRGGSSDEEIESSVIVPGMFERFQFTSQTVTFARNEKFEPEQILILQSKAEIASEAVAKILQVYLLPRKKKEDEKLKRNSTWSSAAEITPEVRKQLEPVKFTVVPAAEENSMTHTFKLDIPAGRFIYVKVPKGLKSFGGYELYKDYESVSGLPEYPRELMIMSQGSLLSLSGDKKIPLLARNLKEVDFTLYRIMPQQLNQFVYQNYAYGAGFSNPTIGTNQTDTMTEVFQQATKLNFTKPSATEYFSLDLAPYLNGEAGRRGLFFVRVNAKTTGESDQRLIVVTDLGVIVKESNDASHDVFVQSLRTGSAVGGADVQVIGANGLPVVEQTTNAEGRVSFPNLKNFLNEKRPIAFVVKKDGDLSFLPYRLESQSLSFSKFDVGGLYDSTDSDKLNAYLFSDRGIYRPGDSANIGMMIRGRGTNTAFKNVPVTWAVTDSRGNEVKREKLLVNAGDLLTLNFKTEETSATGSYSIQVFVSKKDRTEEQIGSLTIRVEEFMPDRMRITASLSQQTTQGWVSPENLKAMVTLKNLFGAAAEDRRVVGEVALNPARPTFKPYLDYTFVALKGDEKPFTESLTQTQTNAQGEASFDLDLARFGQSLYSLRFNAEGYEAQGGRGVASSATTLVSSRTYLVGIKSVDALSYVTKGSSHEVDFIAIDSKLKSIDVKDLKTVIIERRYVSALMQQGDGSYKYQSVLKEISGESKPLAISSKGAKFKLPTGSPGDFALVIRDKTDLELNRIDFSVAGTANLSRSLEKNAELQVTLDKKDYELGSEIELQIKGPYTGAGLITIERDHVLASKWFKTSTTSTVERIKIPAGVEGNAFVNVTFLRSPTSQEIFMSPLSYAVQPFSISLASKRIDLKLDAATLVKPGQALKITYSASRPTKMILYGVDEGILQVAKYKLPDPLTYFFQRRALQVRTYQLLDLLLPEFSIVSGLSAPGGDSEGALSRNLNPFKRKSEAPVVFWSGVLQSGPEKKTFTYNVPDYFNGNIKIMAIASNGSAYGSFEQATVSRGDFIITPTLPNFVVPSDEFEVGVGVSNQAEGTGDKAQVKLELTTAAFDVTGPISQSIEIPEGREKGTSFKLKAKAMFGSQSLRFKASSGSKSAKASVETSIRPASPFMTDLIAGEVTGQFHDEPVVRKLFPEFRKQQATLSPLPIAYGEGLRAFLEQYPYSCSEQLTSKAFPLVILKSKPEFKIDAKKANEFFASTIALLRPRQTVNGGFAMYSADSPADPWISLYVTHLLIEAKDHGFQVPQDLYDRAIGYLETDVSRNLDDLNVARTFAYSRYLLTRAGKVPGADLGFLHQALVKLHKGKWEQDLAAMYLAAAFKIVKKVDEANAIVSGFKINETTSSDYRYFYDGFTRSSASIFLIAKHFPEKLKSKVTDGTLRDAFAPLKRSVYNTHSAAWSILALDGIFNAAAVVIGKLAISEIQLKDVVKAVPLPPNTVLPTVSFSNEAQKIRYQSPPELIYYFSQLQAGFDTEIPKTEVKKGLELTREYLNSSGSPIKSAKMGETIQVRLRVRSLNGVIPHVVMVDLLPSGLETMLEPVVIASESAPLDEGQPTDLPERYDDGENGGPESDGGDGDEGEDQGAFFEILKSAIPKARAQTSSSVAALSPDHVDRREDRMVVYATVFTDIREYVFKARAVAEGNFVIPPAYAEAMYDRSLQYRGGQSGMFKVEAP